MPIESSSIQFSIEGPVARLVLNNPRQHNAMTKADVEAFTRYINELSLDVRVRVLILTGAGDTTFCSGASLNDLSSGTLTGDQFSQMAEQLADLRIPTICGFNGNVYGGGVELAIACDFRLGIEGMSLMVPPARIGLCYPVKGIKRFVQTLGLPLTKRLLIASEAFDAESLLQVGFVSELLPRTRIHDRINELAATIASYSPASVESMKTICNSIARSPFDEQRAQAIAERCNNGADLQEGFRARQEKRLPQFRDSSLIR